MIDKHNIERIIQEKLVDTDLFLVEVRIGKGNKISVFIDSDTSVKIHDCASLSRHIESELNRDVEDFDLEVSSAGLTSPLKHKRQYIKNINRDLIVVTNDNQNLSGLLKNASESEILLVIPENKRQKTEEKEIILPYTSIKEAKIKIKI